MRTWLVLTKNPHPFLQRVGSDCLLVAVCDVSDMVIGCGVVNGSMHFALLVSLVVCL